jgi:hypothetical protein
MVICFSPFISLFALHFTQYPTVANKRRSCALGYKNSSEHACFALIGRKIGPNLGKFAAQNEKSCVHEGKQTNFQGEFKQKLRPAASGWWKSLQLGAPACLEIGIRHEGKSASHMRLPQASR